jgi:hypothetical protein
MAATSNSLSCFRCGGAYELQGRIGLRDVCPACDADLHTCLNCRHYNRSAHNECNEPQAEWVRDKDRANYCDYFDPRRGAAGGTRSSPSAGARARFDDLFKK